MVILRIKRWPARMMMMKLQAAPEIHVDILQSGAMNIAVREVLVVEDISTIAVSVVMTTKNPPIQILLLPKLKPEDSRVGAVPSSIITAG